MTIYIKWYNEEQSLLLQVYSGDWTLKEYIATIEKTYQLISALDHPVDIIADLTNSGKAPVHLASAAPFIKGKISPNQRMVIVVGASHFIKMMATIAQRRSSRFIQNMHFVNTLAEAQQRLTAYLAQT